MTVLSGVAIALAVGVLLQPVVLRVMTRAGVINMPSARSSHARPTPRGGGIAVVCATAAGLLVAPEALTVLAVPLLGYAALGLADDLRGLPVTPRLVVQATLGVAASTILIAQSAPLSVAVTVALTLVAALWLTGYVNAFNFMDGIDGIAAANAVVGGVAFGVIGAVRDLEPLRVGGPVLAAAALTFLPWNAGLRVFGGRARIFLGDVGSYGLGAALATLAAYAALHGVAVEAAIAPLALFLADTGWTLLRRIRAGEPWHQAHRWHAYQRLTDVGFSHRRVAAGTAAMTGLLSVCGLVSLIGTGPARAVADAAAVTLLVVYLRAPARLAGRRSPPARRREAAMR